MGGAVGLLRVPLRRLVTKVIVRAQIVDTVSILSRYIILLCERMIRPQRGLKDPSCKAEGSSRKALRMVVKCRNCNRFQVRWGQR